MGEELTDRIISAISGPDPVATLRYLLEARQEQETRMAINLPNDVGYTALTIVAKASKESNLELISILIGAHADINQGDNLVGTPLHYAACWGDEKLINFLIDHGANVNAKSRATGWTPIFEAVAENREDTIKLPIDLGADVEAVDNMGITPFGLAHNIGSPTKIQHMLVFPDTVKKKSAAASTGCLVTTCSLLLIATLFVCCNNIIW